MSRLWNVQFYSVLFLLSFVPAHSALSQASESHAEEIDAHVAVLSDFHDIIFQIWHTAWPEKNVAMLAELLPQVKQYSDTLARVTLPGILRDKQDAWNQGTATLQEIVAQYEAAAAPLDSVRLLEAAERLHAQYESLVRTIRPITRELDEFHQVLYMIYHHYWPERNLEMLETSVAALKEKMAALGAATLPERWKKKQVPFDAGRASLALAVDALVASDAAEDAEKFSSDLESVHGEYQAVERIFE